MNPEKGEPCASEGLRPGSEERRSGSACSPRAFAFSRSHFILLLAILIAAAALRFWRLGAKSLWLDECMSARLGAMPSLGQMLHEIRRYDVHPPLYQIALFVAMRLGRSEAIVRLPSALAGVASVLLIFFLGRRMFGERVGLVAAALLAISADHIYFSQEARLQSLSACLALAHLLALSRLLEMESFTLLHSAAYVALGVLSLYTYALSALLLPAHWVIFLGGKWRSRARFISWALCHAIIIILFLPWTPVLMDRAERVRQIAAVRKVESPGPVELAGSFCEWMAGPLRPRKGGGEIALMVLAFGAMVGGGLAASRAGRGGPQIMMPSPFVSLSAILAIPIAAHFLLPMPRAHMYEPKHLFMLQPMALLTVAALAHGRRWKAIRLALLLGIAMVNVAGLVNYFRIGLEKEPWRELVAHISSRTGSGDAILFSPAYAGHAFEWYYGGAIPCAGVPEERGRFAERMERELRPTVRRIWLIQCRNAVSTPNPEAAHWLETHWQREESGLLAGILSGEEGGLAYAAYRRPPD